MIRIFIILMAVFVSLCVFLYSQVEYRIGPSFVQTNSTDLVTKWTGGDGASVRLRYPRAAGTDLQTVSGKNSQWANFELMGPELTPASLIPKQDRIVFEIHEGFQVSRPPEIGITLTGRNYTAMGVRNFACGSVRHSRYIGETLFDLVGFDTLEGRGRGPGRLKVDGTRGSLLPVLPAPLGDANLYFAELYDDSNATMITCTYGAPNCVASFNWRGMQASVAFDAWHLEHWRDRRKTARDYLDSIMADDPEIEARVVPDRVSNCPEISGLIGAN
ncbi:hypothetical protein [Actibacterium lipolyticum]|uniref:Uncharacterized protein n=1 Tax=Actibacterium lipolyticum TaxID=1524263 RepID=A0A238KMI3_9RHOB|nr:hypothetical protein [Actibacterium lipolyticum]SMX43362.1 hypothetical protein COL8621_02282 [Actibacterium lipolyticum]